MLSEPVTLQTFHNGRRANLEQTSNQPSFDPAGVVSPTRHLVVAPTADTMHVHASSLMLLGLGLFSQLCRGHNIQLGAHSRECFHESLKKGDKMTVTYQVGDREFGGSGSLEIDFWVGSNTTVFLSLAHGNGTRVQSG